MKTLSGRMPLALAVTGVTLVVFIGFLLISIYLSQVDLQKTAIERLMHDTEKTATAVSYFCTERRSDVKNLAMARAIDIFFENRALGMTMDYGLRASLVGVSDRTSRLVKERKISGDRIYTRVVFIDDGGRLLVDSDRKGREYIWKSFLTPEGKDATIICRHNGKSLIIMASIPYYFKGEYAGQIIAWISPEVIYKHFIKIGDVSSKRVVYVDCGEDYFYLPADLRSRAVSSALFDPADVKIGEAHSFKVAGVEMLALRVPVEDTPFSLITVLPVSDVFGHTSPWYLLLVTGVLAVVILGGGVFVLRINARNLVLGARFDEAKRREEEIAEKNVLLEEEIFMRQRAEEQLKEYSVNLEKMVRERTAKLENALNDLQETQAQLVQSEKMASVGQLAAGVAHEINNPTGFVSSNLTTLSDYQSDIITLIKEYRKLIANLKERMAGEEFSASILEQVYRITSLEADADIDFILDDI
ncbi:MAG: hypothetical protein IMF10_03610, partial [Proteobacteria bacterium]|nr:hypothetical protein [Pseudomonadota bacterium]